MMKKLIAILLLFTVLMGCDNNNDPTRIIPDVKFSVNPLKLMVGENGSVTLSGGDGEKYTVSPTTSDFMKLSVENDKIHIEALKEGEEILTVSSGGKASKLTVTVTRLISELTLQPQTLTLNEGEEGKVTLSGGDGETYTVESQETEFAKIKITNKELIVTALKKGTSEFVVKSADKEQKLIVVIEAKSTPKLAISFLTQNDLGQDMKSFSSNNNNTGFFEWEKIESLVDKKWTIENKKYHVGSKSEWAGIFPNGKLSWTAGGVSHKNLSEQITVQGDSKTYFADYKNTKDEDRRQFCYGLRFKAATKSDNEAIFPTAKDNAMLCAYRYAWVGRFSYQSQSTSNKLEITVRFLGAKGASHSIEDIAKEEYWEQNNEKDIKRIFFFTGYKSGPKKTGTSPGHEVRYWTRDKGLIEWNKQEAPLVTILRDYDVDMEAISPTMNHFSVRLLADEPIEPNPL